MKPETVYIWTCALRACFFALVFTLSAVYRIEVAGLDALQLVLVGTMLEAAVFLFEIPTGLWADGTSRRLSVLIGYALIGVGFLVEGSLPIFGWILVAQVLWGVGFTFTDGAQTAWLSDEIGERHTGAALLRGAQAGHIGSLLGIGAAVVLGSWSLHLPIVLGGFLFLGLTGFLWQRMTETARPTPVQVGPTVLDTDSRSRWLSSLGMASALDTWRKGFAHVRGSTILPILLAVSLFSGLSSEGMDRFWERQFLDSAGLPPLGELPPLYWFGLINAGAMLLSLGAAEVVRRRINLNLDWAVALMLLLVNSLFTASIVVFALSGEFALSLGAFFSFSLLRSVNEPVYEAWVNRHLTSGIRATILSVVSLMNSLGQIVGGPVIGWVAVTWSVPAALVFTAGLLVPVSGFYALALLPAWRRRADGDSADRKK